VNSTAGSVFDSDPIPPAMAKRFVSVFLAGENHFRKTQPGKPLKADADRIFFN
jgi:hypothetical protein